jgi:hypothetical protein
VRVAPHDNEHFQLHDSSIIPVFGVGVRISR